MNLLSALQLARFGQPTWPLDLPEFVPVTGHIDRSGSGWLPVLGGDNLSILIIAKVELSGVGLSTIGYETPASYTRCQIVIQRSHSCLDSTQISPLLGQRQPTAVKDRIASARRW